jgi:protein O-GlcNAc transferase
MIAIPPQASELEYALQQAVFHHRAGRLSEAERLYRGILQVRPDDAGTNNALGIKA